MKKKLAIIGKGTAGCYALSHFMRWTDWEIDLIHDPDIKPQAVGEGSDLVLPASLMRVNYNNILLIDMLIMTE